MPQETREVRDWDVVIQDDLRPAGDGKNCFYCHRPLWGLHQQDCVIRAGASWYHVAIRDNATGEVRMYRHDHRWGDHDHFTWTENNFSCDCNRHSFFALAAGEEPDDKRPCGNERYSVLYAKLPAGTRIPLDESPEQQSGVQSK